MRLSACSVFSDERIFRISFRRPGKSKNSSEIKTVRIPCPGKTSIRIPAINKNNPKPFLTTENTVKRNGCSSFSINRIKKFSSAENSRIKRTTVAAAAKTANAIKTTAVAVQKDSGRTPKSICICSSIFSATSIVGTIARRREKLNPNKKYKKNT